MRSLSIIASGAIWLSAGTLAMPGVNKLQKRTHWATDVAPWWPACPKTQHSGWSYKACYNDPSGTTLAWDTLLPSAEITWDACIDACKGSNFRYAGMRGAAGQKQCLCGSNIAGTPAPSEASCNINCDNGGNNCGGNGFIGVWKDPTFPDYDPVTAVSGYKYIGCFKDDTLLHGTRELRRLMQIFMGNVNNPQECMQHCANNGYPYSGVEYGIQCFCGGKLRTDLVAQGANDGWCTSHCGVAGKLVRRTCGGNYAISVFYNPDIDSTCRCGQPVCASGPGANTVTKTVTVSKSICTKKGSATVTVTTTVTETDDTPTDTPAETPVDNYYGA
ncbi:hypothetical protein H072_10940 [Dactylellina haptotyla CBS 200.50]|uniref:WSC domain-containing protein n=1 Tax=Dactylellina haptotyla (strain CBS 200.50) TaxID=1284197 RepID=S7ZY23_DACHA|nr:hypothetical protein H072_10940 [Dactylellina haptotyla CBS 200.50]